ncbi:MAG: hypothetical protein J6Q22_08035 [Prevotella sp.]|nr:hypothetical protein [Prevotella sp.]
MGNSNKLYFQFGIENIRKTLDAQKSEIDKWAKENPLMLEVKFKNLKSQLEALGAVFGKDSSQLVTLGREVDSVFGKASKGASQSAKSMSAMTSAGREYAELMDKIRSKVESYNAEVRKEADLTRQISKTEERIQSARNKLATAEKSPFAFSSSGVASLKNEIDVFTQKLTNMRSQLSAVSEEKKKLESALQSDLGSVNRLQEISQKATLQQKYNAILVDTEKLLTRINDAINKGGNRNLLDVAARDVIAFQEKAASLSKYKDEANVVGNLVGEYNRLSKVYGVIVNEQEKMVAANEKAAAKTIQSIAAENAARQRSVQTVRAQAEALLKARRETLNSQATSLGKLLSLGENGLGTEQYQHVRDALRAIRQELREIDTIMQRGGRSSGLLLSLGGNAKDYSRIITTAQQYANVRMQGVHAENEMANAIHGTTSALSSQSQVLSDLRTMAQQYVSLWAAKNFVDNIIEQGGQLEQQRLSIGAILQDAAHANELFGKIKSLAIVSPFGVTELDAMTKQLSAYGFKYNDLYDMTKRLADISAATGTEVSRLALALGHVRSEGALSGYTLRQFSMGNIPMLEKLSEKIGVTAKEIRKMVSRKEIGYDQVLEVMKELTDEGGMFYNAQEVMSQALNAKFKNLRDSFQIMYSEMAESAPGDFLKGVAETLTTLSRNWRVLMPMIAAAAGALGLQKAATMALNYELAKEGVLTSKSAAEKAKYTMATNTAIASTGRWTLALRGAGRALASLGKYIFNPVTLGFAAVEGLIYLWQKHNLELEKAKELTNTFGLTGSEGERNLAERIAGIDPYKKGMSDSELKQGIDAMTQSLKDYGKGLNVAKTLTEAFGESDGKVKSLAEQYEFLRGKMEDTLDVYKELQRTADAFEFGINYSDGGWLDENVETDLTDYANAMKTFENEVSRYVAKHKDSLDGMITKAKEADVEFAKAVANMESYSDILRTLWDNPKGFGEANKVANAFFAYAQGGGRVPSSYLNVTHQKEEALKELDSFIEGTEARLKNHGYKFDSLDQKQIDNLMKQTHDWIEKHPEWSSIIEDIRSKIEVRWPIKLEPDTTDTPKQLNDWQQQMQDWLKKHGSTIKIKPGMSRDDIVTFVHNSIKETQKTIDQTKPILLRFGVDLSNIPNELPKGLQTPWGRLSASDYQTAAPQNKTAHDFLNEFGLPQPKEKGSGRKEDKALKDAKTRLEEAKAFLSEYKKYRQTYGKERSISILEELFPTTKGKGQKIVDEYKSLLGQIKNSLKLNTDDRKKFGIDIDKLIAETNLAEAKEKIDRQLKSMEQYISDSVEKYDLYKSLFEKTGSKEFAMSAFSNGQIWDDAAKGLADILKEKMGEKGGLLDWEADKQNAEDWFKKNFTNGEELYKMWEKIVDLISKNYQQALTDGADAASRQLTIAEKIRKVEAEIEELRKKRSNATDDSTRKSYDRQIFDKGNELSKLNGEAFKESLDYIRFFGASLNMANEEIQRIGTAIKAELSKELSDGTITAADYSRTLKEVNKRMEESRSAFKGDFMTFLTQGQKGLVEKQQSAVDDAAIKIAQAEKERQEAVIRGDKAGAAAAEARRKSAEKEKEDALKALGISSKQYETLNSMLATVNIVKGALDGMQKAAESLSEMLDALGHEGSANTWSDIADGIKAVSSSLAPLNNVLQSAMSGNVSGLVSSAISAPVEMIAGPITALAQLHDKRRERQIEDLRRDVQKIDNTLNLIKSLRERTLGYDNGDLRKRLASQYESQMKSINSGLGFKIDLNPAASAMKEYYSRGGLDGSGYKQELEALKKQRQDYQDMWDAENDKKKSSAEALEEYRLKMSELDEQIMFFVEDLSKELWGIDFKAWASQISDALWTAFENGQDAVKAFRDTASDIIADVAKRMMNLNLIEPLFKDLEKDLFGKIDANGNRVGGVYNYDTGQFDESETLRILGQFFGEDGEFAKVINSAESFYRMAENASGFDFSSQDSSSSTSSGIKGITEQTADLLSGYVNGIRAEVSVSRATLQQILEVLKSQGGGGIGQSAVANAQLEQQKLIAANTLRIADATAEIRHILHLVTQGGDRIRVA